MVLFLVTINNDSISHFRFYLWSYAQVILTYDVLGLSLKCPYSCFASVFVFSFQFFCLSLCSIISYCDQYFFTLAYIFFETLGLRIHTILSVVESSSSFFSSKYQLWMSFLCIVINFVLLWSCFWVLPFLVQLRKGLASLVVSIYLD